METQMYAILPSQSGGGYTASRNADMGSIILGTSSPLGKALEPGEI